MAKKLNARTAERMSEDAAEHAPEPKAKAKKSGAAAQSNVSDETMIAAVMECGGYKTNLESANGIYRACLKKWEERGVPSSVITWALKTKRREVGDIEAEFKARNRMLRLLQIPVGTQLGMWDDGESVASKVDGDLIAAEKAKIPTGDEIARAQAEGADCGRRGYGSDVNPYGDGSPRALAWEAGRKSANLALAHEVFATETVSPQ